MENYCMSSLIGKNAVIVVTKGKPRHKKCYY